MNNTLVKGLQLLELLVHAEAPLGVSEMAARLGLGKSNVHRLLQALVELGYANRNESVGSYAASLKVLELGMVQAAKLDIRQAAVPAMERLLQLTRETVHLSVLDGSDIVYVHKMDSPEPVRAYSEIGGRAPAHCVATGKALLAWQSPALLEMVSRSLTRHSANTITDPQELERELKKVRDNGYAVNRGEWRESVWGVAAPIRDQGGSAVGAIGVSGPADRIRLAPPKRFGAEVVKAAQEVARQLKRN